jgi:putative transposase
MLIHFLSFLLSHDKRRTIHFNVTAHPAAQYSAQQLRNAYTEEKPPKFLLRDRDMKFDEVFTETVSALGMEPNLAAYR